MTSSPLALFNGSYLGKKPTGIGVVAKELIKALDPNRFPLLDPLGGSREGSISIPNDLMPECGRMGHIRRLMWTQKKLPNLLKKTDAKFLLSPLPEAPIFVGCRSVVLAHDLLPLRYPQLTPLLAYHLIYVPIVLHNAEIILCNSVATAKEVHSRLKVPIKKIVTIPLGFDQGNLYPLGIEREAFFLVLGRHDPHKNLGRVLKAFALFKSGDMQLWFVGPHDYRYTPRLKALAEELRIADRVRWIPWVSDKERLQLLNKCQALVIASLWEGFGLPALEAMACNTPVIASNAGALPEVVADGGILVDPINITEIFEAMREVLLDGSLRERLISNGKERLKIYRWDLAANQIDTLLASL